MAIKQYLEFCPISKIDVSNIPKQYCVKYNIIEVNSDDVLIYNNGKVNINPNILMFYYKPEMILCVSIKSFSLDQFIIPNYKIEIIINNYRIETKYVNQNNRTEIEYYYSTNTSNRETYVPTLFERFKKIKLPIDDTIDGIIINVNLLRNFSYSINKILYNEEYYLKILNLASSVIKKKYRLLK